YAQPGSEDELVRSLSNRGVHFDLVRDPPPCDNHEGDPRGYVRSFAQQLDVPPSRVRVCIGREHAPATHGQAPMTVALAFRRDDGRWLDMRRRLPQSGAYWAERSLRNILITLAIMIVMVVVATRRFTRPLRELAVAAERFGRGEKIEAVA